MTSGKSSSRNDVSIVVGGPAGHGIQTIEFILARVLKRCGFNVFSTHEYMSRIRGGSNSSMIRVGSERITSYVDRIDIFVPLDTPAHDRFRSRITSDTLVIGEVKNLDTDLEVVDVPFLDLAEEAGGRIYGNTVAVGVLTGILAGEFDCLDGYLREHFARKGSGIVENNLSAARKGYRAGCKLRSSGKVNIALEKDPDVAGDLLISGAEAVSLGAIAGGCNFISAYPMSPGTAVLTYMSSVDEQFGIVAEQAEDEIAAINMAIGAWYAGARAMVTTSGGGFALMEEGISLAGITETPVVVHVGQRPGPATGMATRTEQADLELVLHAGHGEFPRIIYSPGRTEDAFWLAARAFNMADRYQVPVFILTDQYFLDSYYNTPSLDLAKTGVDKCIVETDRDYKRYVLTGNGISPRGVPGYGEGLIAVDSHEHTPDGHITEDIDIRNSMTAKRLGKIEAIKAESVPPTLVGPRDYSNLVISWGSTFHIVSEAMGLIGRDDTAFMHFSQVYPLPAATEEYLGRAAKIIAVENNATAQFCRVLRAHTGLCAHERILKFDGRPFAADKLAGDIDALL
ncbi:MAG: 2-oxoacid:acceptor oxidoreductase subunit alpha [bacterium]